MTNGIAYRRWLLASNPELCKLLDETIGEEYKHDASTLSKLNKYADDKTVLKRINEIKLDNKKNFRRHIWRRAPARSSTLTPSSTARSSGCTSTSVST